MISNRTKRSNNSNLTTLLEREANDERVSRRVKRVEQHKQWMRVMMEGQLTPNMTRQRPAG